MNRYKSLLKESELLKYTINSQINEYILLASKMRTFKETICHLIDKITLVPNINSPSFAFINLSINSFSKEINNLSYFYDNQVDSLMKTMIENFNASYLEKLHIFNEIKSEMIKSKQDLLEKKKIYFNFKNSISLEKR